VAMFLPPVSCAKSTSVGGVDVDLLIQELSRGM
jgi:hypothetical protein